MSFIQIIIRGVIVIGVGIMDVAPRGMIHGTTRGFMVGTAPGIIVVGDGIFTLVGIVLGIIVGMLHGIDPGITVGMILGSMVDGDIPIMGDTVDTMRVSMMEYMLV